MKTLITSALLIYAGCTMAQTPKVYFNCNNTLVSQNGGMTLSPQYGSAQWSTAPKTGNGSHALKFSGTTLLKSTMRIDTVKSMTMSCWINVIPGVEGTYQTVFGQWNTMHPLWQQPNVVNTYGTFKITVQTIDGVVYPRFWMFLSGVQALPFYPTNDSISRGWHHLVYTWQSKADGGNDFFYCYIDGKKIKESWIATNKTIDYASAGQDFYVGGFYDVKNTQTGPPTFKHQEPFTGEVDEIKIFESALDSNQIKTLYTNSVGSFMAPQKTTLAVFPNPVRDNLHIINYDLGNEKNVGIYNLQGQKVIEGLFQNGSIEISVAHLTPGIYYVKTGYGTQKFLKE